MSMKMTLIKTITEHGSQINSFYLLKDNRVAACSNDKVKRVEIQIKIINVMKS